MSRRQRHNVRKVENYWLTINYFILDGVKVNGDILDVPTADVILPDTIPQIVEISANVATSVDPASPDAQSTITVTPAAYEVVANDVYTEIIHTPEGSSDIVVAIPTEVKAELDAAGIDAVAAVANAIANSDVVLPTLPEIPVQETEVVATPVVTEEGAPKVDVLVPDVVPQVLVANVTYPEDAAPVITLEPALEVLPDSHDLVPVITAEGSPDIVVAVHPDDAAALAEVGVDVATDVSTAMIEAEPQIEVATDVEAVEDAPVAEVLPEALPEVLPEAPVETVEEIVPEVVEEVVSEDPVVELPEDDCGC